MKIFRKIAIITTVAMLLSAAMVLAGCGKKEVTIKFETNGGTAVANMTVEKEGTFDLPSTAREGYAFEGWYSAADFSGKPAGSRATAHGDATYYAKWSRLYTLTLDAAGGNVSPGSFQLKQGDSVYDKVKDLSPTYAHHEFTGWYNGSAAVTAGLVMPAAALTLTASYNVEYKIEIYLQSSFGSDDYIKSEDVLGYEKAGGSIVAAYDMAGYHEVKKANTRDTGTISEDYTANVFRLYYDLTIYEITYHSNYPAESGLADESITESYIAGKIPAPYGYYSADGYVFAGWAESASGNVAYKVDYIRANVANADEEATADEITVNKSGDFYAVWVKGCYNLLGGEDIIYYPDKSSQNIYLERGGLYFKGTYRPKANYFFFEDKKGSVMLEGKFTDEEGNDVTESTLASSCAAFAFIDYARDNSAYNLYTTAGGVNDRIQIIFDAYNGITYSVRGQVQSKGIYYVDKDGYYVATFFSGPQEGNTMVVMTTDSEDVRTFRIRNEEEVAFGVMSRGVVVRGEIKFYDKDVYGLKMDGFGNAVFYNAGGGAALTYSATGNENEYDILQNDVNAGVIRVFENGDEYYYMFYDQSFDHEYKISDNASLSLDGVNTLVFSDSGRELTAYYSLGSSVFGNTVTFYNNNDKYVFILKAVTGSGEFVGDQTQTEVTYLAESRSANYAEYFFNDGSGIYYAPLVVFNGTSRSGTHAEVWTRTSSGNFEMVSRGLITLRAGRSVYTESEKIAVENAAVTPIDFSTVKSFEFETGVVYRYNGYYKVNYWYSYTDNADVTHDNTVTFTSGSGTFTVIMPLGSESNDIRLSQTGVYFDGTNYHSGTYSVSEDGYVALRCAVEKETEYGTENEEEYFYFKPDGEFILLDGAPHKTALKKADGGYADSYLYFNGESGKAALHVFTSGTEEVFEGTFVKTGTTAADGYEGFDIYTFTAAGVDPVKYAVYENSRVPFAVKYSTGAEVSYPAGSGIAYLYDGEVNGVYHSGSYSLELDGYGLHAVYNGEEGEYIAPYAIVGANTVSMTIGGKTRYIDLVGSARTFTVKGEEYGVYTLCENNFFKNCYFDLDGYGKLKVYTLSGDAENYIDPSGSYVYNEADGTVTFSYSAGTYSSYSGGTLLSIGIGKGTKAFVPFDGEASGTYLNGKNWSVILLDSAGRAVCYDGNGYKSHGRITVITAELFYYADDNGEDGMVFNYNKTTHVISSFTATERAYYTSDFKSLIFKQNGFVVSRGESIGYYTVSGGSVTIYRQTGEGQYGFTADTSFSFDGDTRYYEGELYYRNKGKSITFARDANSGEHYRIALNGQLLAIGGLYFAPPGSETFNKNGEIEINSKYTACRVTRTDESMFVTVGLSDGSTYKIYISAEYMGDEGSKYAVTGIERTRYIYSSQYLTNYFMYSIYYGAAVAQAYPNNYGTIEIVDKYNETGVIIDSYAEGKFGTASEFFDSEGNRLTFKAAYELREKISAGMDLYIVAFDGEDGFKYNAYFVVGTHPYMNQPAYVMSYIGREETVTSDDGLYEVTVERIIATDVNNPIGALSNFFIKRNGISLTNGAAALVGGRLYYIVRTETGATYYLIDVRYENSGEVGQEDGVLKLVGASVTVKIATTYFEEDGEGYVDFVDGKLTVLSVNTASGKKNFIVIDYEYDEGTGTYTVTTSDNVYTIQIVDGKAVITFDEKPGEEEKPKE